MGVDDIVRINENQKKYSEKYYGSKVTEVTNYGWQPIDSLQAVAYANMYSELWDGNHNSWRHMYLVRSILWGLKDGNYDELERLKKIVLSGDCDIKDSYCISAGAAIKICKMITLCSFPNNGSVSEYKNSKFLFIDDLKNCLLVLHKKNCKERGYKPSPKAKKYAAKLKNINNYVADYKEQQETEKANKSQQSADDPNTNNANSSLNNSSNSSNNSSSKKKDSTTNKTEKTKKPSKPAASEPEPEPTPQPEPEPTEPAVPETSDDQSNTNQDGATE